jgi:hypothetical protein
MKAATTELTLAADPQESQNRKGSGGLALTYPTRAELLVRGYRMRATPAERIRRAYVVEATGCWRWIRGLTSSGYGHLSIRGVYYQAHKIVYILEVGPLPEGLEPDHTCRNRWCVNPADLEFVTHGVNVQRGASSVLTPEQVDEIRQRGRSAGVRALAREYGVNHSTISRIVNGLRWTDRLVPADKAAAA